MKTLIHRKTIELGVSPCKFLTLSWLVFAQLLVLASCCVTSFINRYFKQTNVTHSYDICTAFCPPSSQNVSHLILSWEELWISRHILVLCFLRMVSLMLMPISCRFEGEDFVPKLTFREFLTSVTHFNWSNIQQCTSSMNWTSSILPKTNCCQYLQMDYPRSLICDF